METIIFQLFILSVISERITNFIKLNLQSVSGRLGNFRYHESDSDKEKRREQGIINWAIFIGILVAIFTGSDLFYLLDNGNPRSDNTYDTSFFLGTFLTGCFLSLGSKFWHDLLDLLLQVKNLKGKLVEGKDLEFAKIEEVNEFMSSYEADLIKKVLEERQAELLAIPEVRGIGIRSDHEGYYCELAVTDNSVITPQNIFYNYPPGKVRFLRIKKVVTSEIVTLSKIRIEPGQNIGSKETKVTNGTLGCIVRYKNSESPVLLTCYHVLKSEKQSWEVFDGNIEELVEQPNDIERFIGRIKEAKRNIRVDVAIIEPNLEQVEINQLGSVNSYRKVTKEDENKNTVVRKLGSITGPTEGIVDSTGYTANIHYGNGQYHTLYNLIRIKPKTFNKPFSKPGDSGAIVMDADGQAIGMIVAGTSDYSCSYAIPINTIFNEFNLRF